jgi:hypothetical protein
MKIQKFKPLAVMLFILSLVAAAAAEESTLWKECLQKAIKRVEEIRLLPEVRYISTLDGQQLELEEFFISFCNN